MISAERARAVLPVLLGQLELFQHELDQHAVILGRPVAAAAAVVWRRRRNLEAVKVGARQTEWHALGGDAGAFGRGGRFGAGVTAAAAAVGGDGALVLARRCGGGSLDDAAGGWQFVVGAGAQTQLLHGGGSVRHGRRGQRQ